MEYINDININNAVIHVLDTNADEPVLNEFSLDLDEDKYRFIYKHVEKVLNDDDLKYGVFNPERNIVKEVVQDYLNGVDDDLINLSKELASQLFLIMKGNVNIPIGDLIVVALITDQGPMIGILKMDYVKNFVHDVQFVDNKIGIDIVQQSTGLPSGKIIKAAFIKPIREDEKYNLMILDRHRPKNDDEYGSNYFTQNFLGASIVTNERDSTKYFMSYSEAFIRRSVEDAGIAEEARRAIKDMLLENDEINIDDVSKEIFNNDSELSESYATDLKMKLGTKEVQVDERFVSKKLKRVRLNIDKEIDLYLNNDAYRDASKFEVVRNGDGTINLVVKNVRNYIEK